MRDITLEDTFRHPFSTRAFGTGIPTVLAGTPVLSVLEENNATPITAGVSVSVDRASVVGLNEATIVATAANGYENGKSYGIYISTGTVGGVSVVGEVVGHFTIGLSAAAVDLANATDGLTALAADIATVDGTVNNINSGVGIIIEDTVEIGVAGVGLTNLGGMSTGMKAEVNAEADTAISDAALATAANLAAVKADTVLPEKNVALSNIPIFMVDSTDHVTPKTGLTLVVTRSLDSAAFGSATGTTAEVSSGMYQLDASQADMNADVITFRITATGADDRLITFFTR